MTKSTKNVTDEPTVEPTVEPTDEPTVEPTDEPTELETRIRTQVSSIKTEEAKFSKAKSEISKKSMLLVVSCGEYFLIHGNDKETVETFNKDYLNSLKARDKVSGTASRDNFLDKLREVKEAKGEEFKPADFISEIATDFPKKGDKVSSMTTMREAFQDKEGLAETRYEGLHVSFKTLATVGKLAGQISYDNLQTILLTMEKMGPDKQGSGVIPSDKTDSYYNASLALLTPISKSLAVDETTTD